MRKLLLLLLAASLLVACNNEKKGEQPIEKEKDTASQTNSTVTNKNTPPKNPFEQYLGSFVGAFGENKITLLITRIWNDSIQGRSVVGGNNRPFMGTFSLVNDGSMQVDAREPGDHVNDGVFHFFVKGDYAQELTGEWTPNDKKKPAKTYTLARRKFEYLTNVGSWPEASQRLLKPADLENLMKEDLEFMRNEIFARHGFCFNKKHLRQQFEMEEWYVPNTTDIKGYLTEIEKKNIEMIKRYEKYADEYGDEYGR